MNCLILTCEIYSFIVYFQCRNQYVGFLEKQMKTKLDSVGTQGVSTTTPKARRGRPAKTYFSIQDTMEYIASEGFVTLSEYKNWVIEQKLTNMFPANPHLYYGKQYPGVDAFLGNPPGTSQKRISDNLTKPENRVKSHEKRMANKAKRLEEATKQMEAVALVKAQTSPVSTKPSLSLCFEVLLKHNVSFSTMRKVNKEMQDISIKDAREITNVLFDFLTKADTVKA